VAAVTSSALTGVARIQQNDIWSNSVTFTVPSSGPTLTLDPNMVNMVIGETHNIQALNESGQSVTGLSWASSNSQIVSLSPDDPPTLTALTAGHVTITAGTASADVNVYVGSLPSGTVIWSNPGDGSGVTSIVPAVPNNGGSADVFASNADGTVSAVNIDGTTAWTANLPNGASAVPDFQGGLSVSIYDQNSGVSRIMKLDGITGQQYPASSGLYSGSSIHTDGTIFTASSFSPTGGYWLNPPVSAVGIEPTTGSQEFAVPLNSSTNIFNGNPSSTCNQLVAIEPWDCWVGAAYTLPPSSATPLIAGDGYAYYFYGYGNLTTTETKTPVNLPDGYGPGWLFTDTLDNEAHLMLARVATDGSSEQIDIKDWSTQETAQCEGFSIECNFSGPMAGTNWLPYVSPGGIITDSNTGILLSWVEFFPFVDPTFWLASTSGTKSMITQVSLPGQVTQIAPILQGQDGTFYGTVGIGTLDGDKNPIVTQTNMIAFDRFGNLKWSVPNDSPSIGTADGGVIGVSGITYDNQGRATGQISNTAMQSWTGNGYQIDPGQAQQVVQTWPQVSDGSFSPRIGANPSQNSTALQRCAPLDSSTNAKLQGGYATLTSFLLGKYCPFCDTAIFKQLSTSQAEFTSFLQQGHEFCDGTTSQEPGATIGSSHATVAAYFKADPTTAVTVAYGPKTFKALGVFTFTSSERKTLKVFFDPSLIGNDAPTNESTLFHESLHGFSGLADGGVPGQIGLCDVLGPTPTTKIINEYPECGTETIDITTWILNNIVAIH
jgi:hypothetical protein